MMYASTALPPWVAEDQDRTPYHHAMVRMAKPLLIVAVFLAPYTTWRVTPDFLFTLSDGLFCIAAGLLLVGRSVPIRPLEGWWSLWLIGLWALLLGLLLGSVINGDPTRWFVVASQYGFAFALLPPLLLTDLSRPPLGTAMALVAGVAAMELFGAIVYYVTGASQTESARFGFEFVTGDRRLGAFMADANWNAAMVAMAAPFVLYLNRVGRLPFWAAMPLLAIMAVGLLLSGSVTGFGSTAVAILAFFVIDWSKRSIIILVSIVVLATSTLAAGVALPQTFQHRVGNALASGDIDQAGTFEGRMALIHEAWGVVGRTSVIGLGADGFRLVSAEHAPVHNMYLLVWAEGGLMSLIGWLLMMFVPFGVAIRRFAVDRTGAGLVIAVTISFIAFSTAAPHMYARSWVVPLVLALGVGLSRSVPRKS